MNLKKEKVHLVIDAVCFVDDCLEYGSDGLFNLMKDNAGPKLLEGLETKGDDL